MPTFGFENEIDKQNKAAIGAAAAMDVSSPFDSLTRQMNRSLPQPETNKTPLGSDERNSRAQADALIQTLLAQARGGESPAMRALKGNIALTRSGVGTLASAQRGAGVGQALRGVAATQAGVTGAGNAEIAALRADQNASILGNIMDMVNNQRQGDVALAGARGRLSADEQKMLDSYLANLFAMQQNAQIGEGAAKNAADAYLLGVDETNRNTAHQTVNNLLNAGGTGLSTWVKVNKENRSGNSYPGYEDTP